jgi:hypothetical protein
MDAAVFLSLDPVKAVRMNERRLSKMERCLPPAHDVDPAGIGSLAL